MDKGLAFFDEHFIELGKEKMFIYLWKKSLIPSNLN